MGSRRTARVVSRVLLVVGLTAGCGGGSGGSGKSATGGLLLGLASVSVVPGGSEQLRVLESDGNAVAEPCASPAAIPGWRPRARTARR